MRFLKAAVFFAVSFVAAWVIIFTFIQPPFHQAVPAKLLWYQTDPYPIYYYLIGALVVGLAIGITVGAYYYITLSAELRKARKKARNAEEQLDSMRRQHAEPPEDEPRPRAAELPDPERSPARLEHKDEETGSSDEEDEDVLFEVKQSETDGGQDEQREEEKHRDERDETGTA